MPKAAPVDQTIEVPAPDFALEPTPEGDPPKPGHVILDQLRVLFVFMKDEYQNEANRLASELRELL
jgi:hypothetical protein